MSFIFRRRRRPSSAEIGAANHLDAGAAETAAVEDANSDEEDELSILKIKKERSSFGWFFRRAEARLSELPEIPGPPVPVEQMLAAALNSAFSEERVVSENLAVIPRPPAPKERWVIATESASPKEVTVCENSPPRHAVISERNHVSNSPDHIVTMMDGGKRWMARERYCEARIAQEPKTYRILEYTYQSRFSLEPELQDYYSPWNAHGKDDAHSFVDFEIEEDMVSQSKAAARLIEAELSAEGMATALSNAGATPRIAELKSYLLSIVRSPVFDTFPFEEQVGWIGSVCSILVQTSDWDVIRSVLDLRLPAKPNPQPRLRPFWSYWLARMHVAKHQASSPNGQREKGPSLADKARRQIIRTVLEIDAQIFYDFYDDDLDIRLTRADDPIWQLRESCCELMIHLCAILGGRYKSTGSYWEAYVREGFPICVEYKSQHISKHYGPEEYELKYYACDLRPNISELESGWKHFRSAVESGDKRSTLVILNSRYQATEGFNTKILFIAKDYPSDVLPTAQLMYGLQLWEANDWDSVLAKPPPLFEDLGEKFFEIVLHKNNSSCGFSTTDLLLMSWALFEKSQGPIKLPPDVEEFRYFREALLLLHKECSPAEIQKRRPKGLYMLPNPKKSASNRFELDTGELSIEV